MITLSCGGVPKATCILLSLLFQRLCETESQRWSPKGKSLMRAQVHLSHQIVPGLSSTALFRSVDSPPDCESPAPLPSSDLSWALDSPVVCESPAPLPSSDLIGLWVVQLTVRAQLHCPLQVSPGLWIVQLVVRDQLHCPLQIWALDSPTDCESPASLPSSDLGSG